jgi:CheY-like chemotaxis protein
MTHAYALVVDPNPARRATWASNLVLEGLMPLSASDGAEALALLAAHGAPALLFTELALPFVDGFRVIDQLRRDAPPSDTPVVVVCAFRELREEATILRDRLGIGAILTPDVPEDLLRATVRALLARQDVDPMPISMPPVSDARLVATTVMRAPQSSRFRATDLPPPDSVPVPSSGL